MSDKFQISRAVFEEAVYKEPEDPFTVEKTDFSPFFVFRGDTVLPVVKAKFSLIHWLKAAWHGNWAFKYGMKPYLSNEIFPGLMRDSYYLAPEIDGFTEDTPEAAEAALKDEANQYFNKNVKAYVGVRKEAGWLLLGELNSQKKITNTFKVYSPDKVEIIRESKSKMKGLGVTSMIYEDI